MNTQPKKQINDKEVVSLYNRQSDIYTRASKNGIDQLEITAMFDLLHKYNILRGKVIEIGCGSGQLTRKLLQESGGFSIDATDINKNLINSLQKENHDDRLRNIRIENFYNISSENNSYDLAISNFALNYAQDLSRALREISRVLKINGFLLFSSTVANAPDNKHHKIDGILKTPVGNIEVYSYQYDEHQIRTALQQNKLSLISMVRFSPSYYIPLIKDKNLTTQTFVLLAKKVA